MLELKYKINKFDEIKKCYFDINNIFIINNNEYEKIYISLLKIYNYFNQLGDGFYRNILDYQNTQIKGVEEFNYLYNTHNFNILLWGETGSGKSTFINAIMGEKKSFTQYGESRGTFQDNYYIHKGYPIKIIDVCGFSENEAKINSDKLKNIYEKGKNILIDINDNFSFNIDNRNKIHLLLFFIKYTDKLDIKPCNMPVISTAFSKGIPIIIVISRAEILFQSQNKKISEDSEDSVDSADEILKENNLMETFKSQIKKTKEKLYEEIRESLKKEGTNINNEKMNKIEYVCIDNISKNGLDNLLETIYNKFKDKLILETDLDKIKLNKITKENLKEIIEKSIFLGNGNLNEMILDNGLFKSSSDIKELIIKYYGYYEKKLNLIKRVKFYFERNYYNFCNKIKKRSNTFPLLKNMVKNIYKNFGIEISDEKCTKKIIDYINEYFNTNIIYVENNTIEKIVNLDQNKNNLIKINELPINIIEHNKNNENNIINNIIESKDEISNIIENKENKISNKTENNEKIINSK